ncbi:DUF1961 family protein [Planomonospora sp. ID82291]|uniref:DUF1961 family protein n=1 Tax=Planomonospora sp. ID82291 TaxID=2738136 RepID=UPI0018C419DA|nr:DUF1961 family protein [Planomonospora sp. ID82291]MBG0817187.1 DUF1961 family protein [Planomonospora sp. ID82291]
MPYRNPLASPADLDGFRLEGEGAITFPRGRMRLESLRPPEDGQDANIVLWCPEDFPADVTVEWDFWPVHEPGLCILFFHARGRRGEDLFDLAPRTGPYEQYHHGDLDAYHVSYFRRRWPSERRLHTCNLRKSHGFHLVAQGADPLPAVLDAQGPYPVRLTVRRGEIAFSIGEVVSFRWRDEDPLRGGKIGFRQMAPMIGEYANLRVSSH